MFAFRFGLVWFGLFGLVCLFFFLLKPVLFVWFVFYMCFFLLGFGLQKSGPRKTPGPVAGVVVQPRGFVRYPLLGLPKKAKQQSVLEAVLGRARAKQSVLGLKESLLLLLGGVGSVLVWSKLKNQRREGHAESCKFGCLERNGTQVWSSGHFRAKLLF